MPAYQLPNTARGQGRVRKAVIQSLSSVNLGTASSPQTETDIPVRGDLAFLEVVLTGSLTGTLSGAADMSYLLSNIAVKDKAGRSILSSIRGKDLELLDFFLNRGRQKTYPNVSNSAQTVRYILPLNVEVKDMTARIQATLEAYNSTNLASSGATGGTVSLDIIGWYMDDTDLKFTQRIYRLSQSVVSGLNRFAPNLPKDVVILYLLLSIGTESNLTNITFSANGAAELDQVRVTDLTGVDDVVYTSGHQTGLFSLYNSAFKSDTNTILDVTAGGSDTIQWYTVIAD